MARNLLNDADVKAATAPEGKRVAKLFDGEGLGLWVTPIRPRRGRSHAPAEPSSGDNRGERLCLVLPELSPSHAWRHTFLSKARQAGIEPALRFGIPGHASRQLTSV
jgi:hypothetical protein